MNEGWVIAIGEYNNIRIYIKHCNILESYNEAILIPITQEYSLFPISQQIISAAGVKSIDKVRGSKTGSAFNITKDSISQTKIVLCIVPDNNPSDDLIMNSYKFGLDICNKLNCSSACIPLVKLTSSLVVSAEILMESIENFALANIGRIVFINEIVISVQKSEEINAVIEASKFRMTKYSSFINIGPPGASLNPFSYYCKSCCKIFLIRKKCSHFDEENQSG